MNVEVKLELFEDYDEPSLEGRIIKLAADRLAVSIEKSMGDTVHEEIMDGLGDKVETLFFGIVDHPIKKTNQYGEARGSTTTLRELIMAKATAYLQEQVDSKTGEKSRYGNKDDVTRVTFIAREAMKSEFAAVMEPELKSLRATAKAELEEMKSLLKAVKNK